MMQRLDKSKSATSQLTAVIIITVLTIAVSIATGFLPLFYFSALVFCFGMLWFVFNASTTEFDTEDANLIPINPPSEEEFLVLGNGRKSLTKGTMIYGHNSLFWLPSNGRLLPNHKLSGSKYHEATKKAEKVTEINELDNFKFITGAFGASELLIEKKDKAKKRFFINDSELNLLLSQAVDLAKVNHKITRTVTAH